MAGREESEGEEMSERLDKEGCFLSAFTMAIVFFFMYVAIDMWADRRDQYHIRDLQRRIASLEQQSK